MINLTYSYRIYPTQEQASRMEAWLEQLRQVYNYALAERKTWIKSRKCEVNACSLEGEYILPTDHPQPTFYSQKKSLTRSRQQNSDLADLHSQVLQEVLGRVDLAFKMMWDRGLGFPRFKKVGRLRSMVFPQLKSHPIVSLEEADKQPKSRGFVSPTEAPSWQIKLPKIGLMPIVLHRSLPSGFVVKQIRVLRKASGWFALLSLQANISLSDPLPNGALLGLHYGREKQFVTSDGERISRSRVFEKRQRQLKSLQRRLKRKQSGSKNFQKLHRRIARSYERIDAARKNYYYNVAHHLCDRAGTIFVQDLTANTIANGLSFRHQIDANCYQFLQLLAWVCWKRGVYFSRVEAFGVDHVCPQCRVHISSLDTHPRTYQCPECGYHMDRDVAAAQVLLQRGIAAVGHAVAGANLSSLAPNAYGGDLPGAAA